MKQMNRIALGMTALLCSGALLTGASPADRQRPAEKTLKVCVVNFKLCVEQSKMGKKEQANFEALKKQMEGVVVEKEKSLSEMASKLEDPDYLDSLSPEAETELKRKFRGMSAELQQLQQQYMQTLNQTHYKALQKMNDGVNQAAKQIADKEGYDLVLNEEAAYFSQPRLDISKKVIAILDDIHEKEEAENKSKN